MITIHSIATIKDPKIRAESEERLREALETKKMKFNELLFKPDNTTCRQKTLRVDGIDYRW